MMFSIWTLVAVTVIYIAFLFVVAVLGNKAKKLPNSVYSLALGIHCTSWAFFGTSTQASQFGWALVPTYLGIMLFMVFGFSLLKRINQLCKQYKIASIAEFISLRYQHSNTIAVLVTFICFVGVIPYIALQLDAITTAINLLVADTEQASQSISLFVTFGMAFFAIWFGARRMNLVEQNKGLMVTIAVQSLIKLIALTVIGLYVVYGVFDGFVDLADHSLKTPQTREIIDQPFAYWIFISHVVLGICSLLCLPRQFHVNFVENRSEDELNSARWIFPSYLLAMSLFVLPIALAGNILFANSAYTADSFVLAIPISMQQSQIAVIGFLGGLAASSSMVIVATLALGNMMANSIITPMLLTLKQGKQRSSKLSGYQVLRIRQITISVMLFIAYWYHVYVSESTTLVETGTIAISLLAQTFPAMVIGIYWKKANKLGALLGLLAGVSIIVVGMLLPAILSVSDASVRLSANEIASVLFLSLSVNALTIVTVSLFKRNVNDNVFANTSSNQADYHIQYQQLLSLIAKLLPQDVSAEFEHQTQYLSANHNVSAPQNVLYKAQNLLSSHLGSASTRILLNTISEKPHHDFDDMSDLIVQAGKHFQFNKEVLQASITHLPLGVSVIDADLKLVAWNQLYEELFNYPNQYLQVGMPIVKALEYNASRGLLGDQKDIENDIQKRMHNMLIGRSYKVVKPNLFGKVIEISGHPLPAGGYITCYSNITEYIEIQNALKQSKEVLEERVTQRTSELECAKIQAEQANVSKTKFLAATSHDLMQPLNAASLFASMLKEQLPKQDGSQGKQKAHELTESLLSSLDNAEALLSMLVEITKLENNQVKPNIQAFSVGELLQSLSNEYQFILDTENVECRYVPTSVWVNTDRRLLTRIIQNLLSNAVRYTSQGRILLGVRRRPNKTCEIIVADTGAGIEQAYQQKIFEEFTRVHPNDEHAGLGLGLTIVERTSALLNLTLKLQSIPNKGSMFSLVLPCVPPRASDNHAPLSNESLPSQPCKGKTILLLENDAAVSDAVKSLLSNWGADVYTAVDHTSAIALLDKSHTAQTLEFDLIVADYHLNNGDTGVEVALQVIASQTQIVPVVLSSADRSEEIQALAYEHNMRYLPKPIKQAALKRLIQKLLS